MLYYFYHMLTDFNKLKIMSEIVLLLPNTDHLKQVKDYKIMSEIVLLLPNTDRLKQFDDYLRGSTWQLKKVKTIYRFHELVFDWENVALNFQPSHSKIWPVPVCLAHAVGIEEWIHVSRYRLVTRGRLFQQGKPVFLCVH